MSSEAHDIIKICGLTDSAALTAACDAGADFVGFVNFAKSPRHLELAAMADLAAMAPPQKRVVLLVDPDDDLTDAVIASISPFALQLHGSETPARVAALKTRIPDVEIWKALPVADPADISAADAYRADRALFDAKPPQNADRPGGWGDTFDWSFLDGANVRTPWLLAGGLNPDNVAEAIRATDAPGVDVSSGVERAPGVKDPKMIEDFIAAARAEFAQRGD